MECRLKKNKNCLVKCLPNLIKRILWGSYNDLLYVFLKVIWMEENGILSPIV